MLNKFVRIFGGDPNKREIEKFNPVVDQINSLEPQFEGLSDEQLRDKTVEFRGRLSSGEDLNDILPEAFAAVREASKRTLGLRHYDVQLVGGVVLHQGKIAEMRTGEGKTLVATLPLYLNALTGRGVHLITVNDYLARRDARWMGPVFAALSLRVGVLQMAARTENGKKAFLVNLDRRSPHEDQDQLDMVPRREAYLADITYGTNSEFGFDYLRDNMTMSLEERVQRGHYYAIVDEVDNVLIDEARTPLIISGPAHDDTEWYVRMAQVIRQLRPEDYEISERDRTVTLTEIGESHVEEVLGIPLRDPDRPEDVTPEQARLLGYLEQALRAQFLFKRNKDYLVQGGKVTIIDEFTGRLMPGRRWSDGLHQAVEAKEGARVQSENVTYATITIQNYFRMYDKLAGMTGTALTEAEEFSKIYKLDVLAIPTNLEFQASQVDSSIIESEGRDEAGYKYHFYTHREDPENIPVFWKRKDYPDVIFRTEEAKFRAITQEILRYHVMGRPLLVGTTSVELSERLSTRLRAEPLRRLAQVILIREAWLEKNNREEDGRMIPELQPLNQPLEQLQVPDLRKMARELDVSFSPEDTANLERLQLILNLGEEDRPRLMASLQAGIPHQVLNARKHTEESQIIAGAGAFGGVMIATNMAGRGVDIKLGGELAEEVLVAINRVLEKAGYDDPYNMTPEDRRQALQALDPGQYGIYESEVLYFLEFMENSKRVKELGGLHVIGSERHEARRIDNQLRGRAARQGDPGSSRFYLSLEDELMRRFGGQQANDMMQRLKVDDAMPIEVGLVGRIVEQSQTRVEGANFDVRKHLLEYDDVLNTQRASIYTQRNRIFTKQDLSEDVTEMLRTEVMRRVPEALKDPEGPWKLLAWLDQIQPTLSFGGNLFPSYSQSLLLKQVLGDGHSQLDRQAAIRRLQDIAGESLKAEGEHLLRSVYNLLDLTEERLKATQAERMETLETYFEGLDLEGDEETGPRQPREIVDELSALLHMSLRLNPEQLRALRDDPDLVQEDLRVQVQAALYNQAITRLVGALERRLEEPLGMNPSQLSGEEWEIISDQVLDAVQAVLDSRFERLLGDDSADSHGQIGKDLESAIERADGSLNEGHLLGLLTLMPQGSRAFFDRKTHRKMMQRTTRLTYVYHAAKLLENKPPEEIAGDVLAHLEEAQANIRRAWGASEWGRISAHSPAELDKTTQEGLRNLWGEEVYAQLEVQPLANLSAEQAVPLVDELGRQALTEVYRQLLLGVITELWVDYLTQMEALRVAIGLEAYAQRDPLVQYKNKAFALFQDLLGNMRLGVVTRMFTFQPRDMSRVQAAVTRAEASRPEAQAMEAAGNGSDQDALPDEASRRSMAETTATTPVKVTQQASGKPAPSGKSKRRRRRR